MKNAATDTGAGKPGRLGFPYYRECPVCASPDIKDKFLVKDFMIAGCPRCTAVFVKDMVSADYLAHYYQTLDGHFAYNQDNQKCLEYYYRRIKKEIYKIKPTPGTILDIGCSSGFFLEQMTGWERHGIEIAGEVAAMARARIGENIFKGSFEDYPGKENYFDVITLQDVFDHFIDPTANLKKCYSLLKPGGLLIIKVHNISCLYARLTGAGYNAIIPPSHLFYFNRASLKFLLNKTGLTFLKAKYIGHILQLKIIFYRLSQDQANTFFYKIYRLFEHHWLGNIRLYKNLRDIITVFAIKK